MSREDLRSQSHIAALRERARTVTLSLELNHSPEVLWPFVSNTDMVNAETRLPPVTIRPRPTGVGGSELSVESTELGLPMRYEELPYEWQRPLWLSVERIFVQGPAHYLRFETRLEALPEGRTRATLSLHVVPKLPWIFVRQRARQILTRMQAVYAKIDARAAKQKPVGVEVFLADPTRFQAQISQLSASWRPLTEEPRMAELLASYIYTAPDRYVLKLRPFELAELYGLDPMATLRFFLKATRAGFLNLSWDLLCPGCQGAKAAASSLSTLNPHAHCDICDIDYTVSLDENFELTFHPVATVRSVFDTPFCAGSPSNTGHLAQQFNVWPREHKQLTLSLPSGSYRFRCPSMQGYVAFEVALGGQRQYQLLLGEAFDNTAKLILAPACEVQIVNQRNLFQTLRIEDLAWRSLRVSAALVSSLQDFRDSFSSEVLRPGVQLAVSNLTVMFTDLKDSTSMYELRGDATAFSLVQEHFDIMRELISGYQGAIVKTIGDAVMAVFQDPLRALRCALEIQQVFGERKQRQPEHPIVVKLGLHLGPSIALNLNERLDYFGTTVNKAARIQSESLGEDIVLSPAMLESEGVLELIAGMPLSAFEKNLKGLSGLTRLYRLEPLKPQPALSDGETPMIAKPSA